MAKAKAKEEVQETQDEQSNSKFAGEQVEEVLTEEQQKIRTALENNDVDTLKGINTVDGASNKLVVMIATYLALSTALGADAGATKHAYQNLWNYKPEVEKAAKAKKEPAFNEKKALKDALASENVDESLVSLLGDERISSDLNIAIVTFRTLSALPDLPEEVLAAAKATLESFGSKPGKGKSSHANREAFHIEANGIVYTTLAGALEANGNSKTELVGEKKHRQLDIAWRATRGKILAEGVAEYNGVTYTKVAVSDNAIGIVRKAADKPVNESANVEESNDNADDKVDEEVYE